jgi:signal transduction histidine kinase
MPDIRLSTTANAVYIRRMVRFLQPLREGRTYLETIDLLIDFPFAVAWFTVFTTLIATGVSLLITLVGLPILTLTFIGARWIARFERLRADALLGVQIEEPRARVAAGSGFFRWLVAPFRDRTTWKEVGYLWLVAFPFAVVSFTVAVVAWSVPLWLVTLPIYVIAWPQAGPDLWGGHRIDTAPEAFAAVAIGLVVLPLTPWVIRAVSAADAFLLRSLLSPSRTDELEERVDELRETQARSVDIAIADRRQIERDLHDGAQQRLLALGMDLGMALDKLEDDPEAARALVGDAHEELQRAIVELRNLARGIHPAVLTDRGLDAALSSLAARSAVPVRLDVRLDRRPPASAEATAYFIVAEALTNAARHGRASHVDVRVRLDDGTLHVEVKDDGVGGASATAGGGLAGLTDRASSVEGTLRISSPPGGPTVVSAELPCAS